MFKSKKVIFHRWTSVCYVFESFVGGEKRCFGISTHFTWRFGVMRRCCWCCELMNKKNSVIGGEIKTRGRNIRCVLNGREWARKLFKKINNILTRCNPSGTKLLWKSKCSSEKFEKKLSSPASLVHSSRKIWKIFLTRDLLVIIFISFFN